MDSRSAALAGKVASLLLALVLPIVILAGAVAGLESFRTFADKREARNAGKVINGRVVEGGVIRVIEGKLAKNEPDVVILGNSLSNTDILPPLLARRLGLPRTKVQKFSIPNSMGAHWYAILKNRVYATGHHPKVVMILSDLQSLLALAPRSEASYLNLSVQLTAHEPVIDDLLGTRYYYLERVRENRGKLRDKVLEGTRNAMVDLFVNHTFTPTDDRKIEAALGDVFDSSRTDMRLHNNVIPIFNTQSERDLLPFDPETLPEPEASFIPKIAELVEQNGGRLVFVRPPMSPLLPEGVGDIVLPESERRVPLVMTRHAGVYLDMRTVPMEHTHFHNVDHMNPEGARRFTEIIAEMFEESGLNGHSRPSAELLKSTSLDNGVFKSLDLDVAFKDPPLKLPRPDRPFAKGRGRLLFYTTEGFAFLNDTATIEVTPHASRCSPVRVLEDGVPLSGPNAGCEEVTRQGLGRTCQTADKLFFTTSDDSNAYTTDRTYSLALDPARSCDASLWLYPGDKARLTVRREDMEQLVRGVGALRVVANDFGGATRDVPQAIQVRLRAGKEIRLEGTLPLEGVAGRGVVLPIAPRIPANTNNLQLELVNPTGRYVLLTSLRLMAEVPRTAGQ